MDKGWEQLKGKTIKDIEQDPYRAWINVTTTDGFVFKLRGYTDSIMGTDRWPAIYIERTKK
jgi:hypothetical protein